MPIIMSPVHAQPQPYPELLLAVIAAPTSQAKALLLAQIAPPVNEPWTIPVLPIRPGRSAHYQEVIEQPRRRKTLKHEPTRNRFLAAIHHIELSAIDLAVAACLFAPDMPADFHADELRVAREEAEHAALLEELLCARGCPPGSFPIHHRLWDAARAAADLGELLVVVPRFLEARGLDVSAELLPRLAALDPAAHAVIARIYHDEITHVAIGTTWHRRWCVLHGLDPDAHFAAVVRRHFADQLPGPTALDHAGREKAGFSAAEMAVLSAPRAAKSPPPASCA
jgi:uncharacterized ferritin-like protein (DUF455 family)